MAEEKDTAAPAKRTAGKTGRRKKPEAEHAARAAPMDKDTGSKAQEILEQARTAPKPEWEVAEQVVLVGQNQGVQNIEISDKNIRDFDRVARKYGIDYAVKKDTTEEIPKYLVFFKARDGDALNAAFREYSAVVVKKKERPSVIQKLRAVNPLEKAAKRDRVRHKDKGLEL